jgi:hypothetical protein
MLSAVINSLFIDDEKPNMLKRCMDSLSTADEVIALVTTPSSKISFAEGYNKIVTQAKGDYIFVLGDSFIAEGDLKDLCIPETITVPNINNKVYPAESMMAYCMPKDILVDISKEFGLYDPIFYKGSHWEDTDLWRRAKKKYKIIGVESVNLNKPVYSRTIGSMHGSISRIDANMIAYRKKWGNNNSD